MKKFLSVVLACALLVGCVMIFASCGLSGTYEKEVAGTEVSFAFKGNKVTLVVDFPIIEKDLVLNGTYELGEDEEGNKTITITYEDDSSDEAKKYGGTLSFAEGTENGEKYVSIGGVRYFLED